MQITCSGIGMPWGKAEIPYMIWSAGFVEQYVPVGPGYGAVVEIVNHGCAISFAPFPVIDVGELKTFGTAFGKYQVFARKTFVNSDMRYRKYSRRRSSFRTSGTLFPKCILRLPGRKE